jgi:hypothetical protein
MAQCGRAFAIADPRISFLPSPTTARPLYIPILGSAHAAGLAPTYLTAGSQASTERCRRLRIIVPYLRMLCCGLGTFLESGLVVFIFYRTRLVGTRSPSCTPIGPALRSLKASNWGRQVGADGTSNVTEMQRKGERTNGAQQTRPGTPAALTGLLTRPCQLYSLILAALNRAGQVDSWTLDVVILNYRCRIMSLNLVTSAALDAVEAASSTSLSVPVLHNAHHRWCWPGWGTSQPQRSHTCTYWHHRSVRPGCGTDTRFILAAVLLACMIRSY